MIEPPPAASAESKSALRSGALRRRDALDAATRAAASDAIAVHAQPLVLGPRSKAISFYWPIRSEVDPRPLIEAARKAGAAVALPVLADETVFHFRKWTAGTPLLPAGFGTSGPGPDAPEVTPDVIVLPLAGFDRTGHRLGYGKGHYDRAVSALHAAGRHPLLIGLAFSVQEVPRVPAEAHDIRLHAIVTERETLDFRKGKDRS
jgi:5-formyltetrahydrofolate cyclo-ligase